MNTVETYRRNVNAARAMNAITRAGIDCRIVYTSPTRDHDAQWRVVVENPADLESAFQIARSTICV